MGVMKDHKVFHRGGGGGGGGGACSVNQDTSYQLLNKGKEQASLLYWL